MNYYKEIKNEVGKKVREYVNNKNDLITYYEVGRLLTIAGKHYGEGIIIEYANKLKIEIGKKYSVKYLFDIKRLYLFLKVHPVGAQLTISHYRILFSLKDNAEIDYYVNECIIHNYSKRELDRLIKKQRISTITTRN